MTVGTLVGIVRPDEWELRGLDEEERARALSMVGETFEVFEIDDHAHPCVMKEFPGDTQDRTTFHSIALDSDEFESFAQRSRHGRSRPSPHAFAEPLHGDGSEPLWLTRTGQQ